MNPHTEPTRRDFISTAIAGTAAAAMTHGALAADDGASSGLPRRPLGKTGEKVSCLGLGGYHIGAVKDPDEAIRIMHAAIDEGLTFWDNAWDYHNGGSEIIVGKGMKGGKRDKVFLMTKVCARDKAGVAEQIDQSLQRLQTDRIDLLQFHEINYDNDPDWLFDGGAMESMVQARKAGKVRYIGFTGHKDPRIHLAMLAKDFDWDTAQMPLSVMDAHYRSFAKEVLPVLNRRGIGALAMKTLCGGAMIQEAGLTVEEGLSYALNLPVSTVISGIQSMEHLKANVAIARAFKPLSRERLDAILAKAKPFAGDGRIERFKSTQAYDAGYHRKQHGFT